MHTHMYIFLYTHIHRQKGTYIHMCSAQCFGYGYINTTYFLLYVCMYDHKCYTLLCKSLIITYASYFFKN
jgi:hypothetical protein